MEPFVFEDSPIAQYLEGQGTADHECSSSKILDEPTFPFMNTLAPRNLHAQFRKARRKAPHSFHSEASASKGVLARLHDRCSTTVHSQFGWTENAHFLEQFRYVIVASQLLNERSNPITYRRQIIPPPSRKTPEDSDKGGSFSPTWLGLALTGAMAYVIAWSVRWLLRMNVSRHSASRICLFLSVIISLVISLYYYWRRQWLQYLRIQAIDGATSLTTYAQEFDAVVSAGIALLQEMEIVLRGYNINPLPPITRLEDQNTTKKCARLRRTIQKSLISMFSPYHDAYLILRPLAVSIDLEKYYDIYEISRIDTEDAELLAKIKSSEIEDADSLQDLKISLQKLRTTRKLFLCTLLALSADGSKLDFQRWSIATEVMSRICDFNAKTISLIDGALSKEEDFSIPSTPKLPLTPASERVRSQLRQLSNLSQGIRCLQAKLRLLQDNNEGALERAADIMETRNKLLSQYDSIGVDLNTLMHEWQEGRVALVTNLDKKDHRRSMSSPSNTMPLSPTLSLGGTTVGGSSPRESLQVLNALPKSRSRSATDTSSSCEEIFEAVALPHQRSTQIREARIAKMKEDCTQQAIVKESTDANATMLKELEAVIKLRPRGQTTGRLTSI